jgi:branched-subunit amino acid aminotransferase/4-amino-4-deoxychorismate lyase
MIVRVFVVRVVIICPLFDAGVTRHTVMEIVRSLGLPLVERRISLAEFHCADEVFTTGTMGELTPVYEIDGRAIGEEGAEKAITRRIQAAYTALTRTEGCRIPKSGV